MAHEVYGVIASAKGAPVSVTKIVVPDPGPGEALVRVQACGVCHTDLHYRRRGDKRRLSFPFGPRSLGDRGKRGRRGGERGPRRLRHYRLARSLWRLPFLCAGPSLVLLREPQRLPTNDAG